MKTVAYLKTFLDRQDVREQRQAILEFAQREEITLSASSRCLPPLLAERGLVQDS
jgi:hypothetical protein